jgi:hypothetical protein
MSACSIGGTVEAASGSAAKRAYDNVNLNDCPDKNVYEAALRLYFGLLPDEEITEEQLAEITEIKIIRGIKTDGLIVDNSFGLTPVSFVINGRAIDQVPSIVHKRVFEEYIIKTILENGGNQRELDRINAYYNIYDLDAPDFTLEAAEELLMTYPILAEYQIARFDPNTSEREYRMIHGYFAVYGLLNDSYLQDATETIDVGYLANLPNLKTATFVNLTAINSDLLFDTIKVIQEESTYVYIDGNGNMLTVQGDGTVISMAPGDGNVNVPAQNSPNQLAEGQFQGPSGTFTPPNYGINIAPDGTEYLEFKNQSLKAAILEYFGLDWWDYITLDMLNQIYSIDVNIKDEYNYIYDNVGLRDEFNLDCKYIEYTINGKTLDVLPEKFMEGGIIEPTFGDNISEYFDYEPGYYITKTDLSDNVKKCLYYALADNAANRISVYIDGDGKYFTVTENPSMFVLGFTARYYDKDQFDATDLMYIMGAVEFNLNGITAQKGTLDGLPVK